MGETNQRRRRAGWSTSTAGVLIVLIIAFLVSSGIYRHQVGPEEVDRGIGHYGNELPLWVPEGAPLEPDRPVRVLSLDAGGIRGILELHVLTELERQTGKPVSQLFDLVVGSSTGAVIGASLLVPEEGDTPKYSAQDLLDNYVEQIRLFTDMPWYHSILTLGGWIGPRYPTAHGRAWVVDQFGQATLAELQGQLVIATVDLDTLSPRVIPSRQVPGVSGHERARNFFVGDVVLAATAAPPIIPPMLLRDVKGQAEYISADGALFAHNPATLAVGEAIRRFPGRPIILMSLGTGSVDQGINGEQASAWGMVQWAMVTDSLMIDPRSKFSDQILQVVAGREGNHLMNYLRINPTIPEDLHATLLYSPDAVARLDGIGRESVQAHAEDIKVFSEKLLR